MTAREIELGRRVVGARAEQHLVTEERPQRCNAPRDRGAGEPGRAQLREVRLELLDACARDGSTEPVAERSEVTPVGVDRARSTLRGEQREEAVDVLIVRRNGSHERDFASTPCSPATSGARMRAVVDPAKALPVHVAVHLRGR